MLTIDQKEQMNKAIKNLHILFAEFLANQGIKHISNTTVDVILNLLTGLAGKYIAAMIEQMDDNQKEKAIEQYVKHLIHFIHHDLSKQSESLQ